MKRILQCVIVVWAFSSSSASAVDIRFLQYDGFQLVFDCDLRSATRFSYSIGPDSNNLKRRSSFSKDPDFPSKCQQHSGKSYNQGPEAFDRGHLVPANHLDHLKLGIRESNYVTNILPQARNMKRGAWLRTEEIIECYREEGVLQVFGGPIYSTERDRDFFTESHGVRTPSAFWKVIISESDNIAWIIPNTSKARRSKLNEYIVPIKEIEVVAGEHFQSIDEASKNQPAISSWDLPDGCDLS